MLYMVMTTNACSRPAPYNLGSMPMRMSPQETYRAASLGQDAMGDTIILSLALHGDAIHRDLSCSVFQQRPAFMSSF